MYIQKVICLRLSQEHAERIKKWFCNAILSIIYSFFIFKFLMTEKNPRGDNHTLFPNIGLENALQQLFFFFSYLTLWQSQKLTSPGKTSAISESHSPLLETVIHVGRPPLYVEESDCHNHRQTRGHRLSWTAFPQQLSSKPPKNTINILKTATKHNKYP
jgi:hypothetical protein